MSTSTVHADGHGTTGACTYGRFWNTVGEPRGVEYKGVLALFGTVLALFSLCLALVWHCFTSVLLNLVPVLLVLGPVLLNLVHVLLVLGPVLLRIDLISDLPHASYLYPLGT